MKKKILCAILSAMLIISSIPFAISAAPSKPLTGYEVELARVDYQNLQEGDIIYAEASGGDAMVKDKNDESKGLLSNFDADHYVDTTPVSASADAFTDLTKMAEVVNDPVKGNVLHLLTGYSCPIGINREATQDGHFYTNYGKHPNLVKFEMEFMINASKIGYILLNGNNQGSYDICRVRYQKPGFYDNNAWVDTTTASFANMNVWHKITLYVDFQTKKYIGFFNDVYQGEYTLRSANSAPELFAFAQNTGGVFYINYMSISTILPYGENTDISAYQDFTGATQYGYIMNNDTASDLNYGVYCARFDSDGKLENVVLADESVAAGNTGVLKNLPTQEAPDGGYCVYFVWENFTTLKPLFEQTEVR